MNTRGTVGCAAVGVAAVFGLVLGLVILGGGGSSVAGTAPGLKHSAVPVEFEPWVLKAGGLCPATVGPAAIAAQIDAESAWDPHAQSSVGAAGIAQFMPGTWPQWAADDDGTGQVSPWNPRDSIMAQGRYMCALADTVRGYIEHGQAQGEVLDLALAAYNAGPGAVAASHGIPHNGQTEVYVARIRQLMSKYSAPINVSPGGAVGPAILAAATSQLGKPYVWGGGDVNGPTGGGFDCSGLVMFAVYQGTGGRITLAQHLADWQARQGQPVTGPAPGAQIDLSLLLPGDVIGFADPGTSTWHHIGIYAGNGQLVHAPDFGETVKVAPLNTSYWQTQIWQVRRIG